MFGNYLAGEAKGEGLRAKCSAVAVQFEVSGLNTHDPVNECIYGDYSPTIRVHRPELTIFILRIAASSTTMKAKKPTLEEIQAVRCPTCGAGPGEKCELSTGQPRTEPHRDRRLIAAD